MSELVKHVIKLNFVTVISSDLLCSLIITNSLWTSQSQTCFDMCALSFWLLYIQPRELRLDMPCMQTKGFAVNCI